MLRGSGFSSGCGATLRFRAGDQGDHPYCSGFVGTDVEKPPLITKSPTLMNPQA